MVLLSTEHSTCNHMMTLGFKGSTVLRKKTCGLMLDVICLVAVSTVPCKLNVCVCAHTFCSQCIKAIIVHTKGYTMSQKLDTCVMLHNS